MAEALQYIVDENGDKSSVLVPLKIWEQLNNDYLKLQNEFAIFSGIQTGFDEVEKSKKSGRSLQTLRDILS